MAVTATSAVLDVIDWQKLKENARETGIHLKKRLTEEIYKIDRPEIPIGIVLHPTFQ
mgnify:CR=1 FL=1